MQRQQDNLFFFMYVFLIPTHFSLRGRENHKKKCQVSAIHFQNNFFPNSSGGNRLTVKICKPQKAIFLQSVAKFHSINNSFGKNMW